MSTSIAKLSTTMVKYNVSVITEKQAFLIHLTALYNSLKPIFVLSYYYGTFPILKIKEHNKIVLKISNNDWLYVAFYLSTFLALMFYNVKMIVNEEVSFQLSKSFELVFFVSYTLQMFFFMIIAVTKRENFVKCLKSIARVDCMLSSVNVDIDYDDAKRFCVRVLTTYLFLIYAKIFLMFFVPNISYLKILAIGTVPLLKLFISHQFTTVLVVLKNRFKTINAALVFTKDFVKLNKAKVLHNRAEVLCKCHAELCKTSDLLGATFQAQLFSVVFSYILCAFMMIFFFYYLFSRRLALDEVLKLIIMVFWAFEVVVPPFGVLKFASDSSTEVGPILTY